MTTKKIEIERAKAGCGVELAAVHRAVALFYALITLCNGPAMLREAELMRYGRGRDVAVALARPLAAVSHATGLDRPRRWIENLVHRGD